MARILVRDIEDEVKARLQRRAARNGRSMEAEVRDILRDAAKADDEPGGLGTDISSLFKGIGLRGDEELAELRGFSQRPVRAVIVLDTNVVSTLMRDPPDPAVLHWLDGCPRGSIWTTSITVLEVKFGLAIMADGRRRTALEAAFDSLVEHKLERRVAGFDALAAQRTATLMGVRQQRGTPRDIRDSMIAGLVLARQATLATRNVAHFDDAILDLVDPWNT